MDPVINSVLQSPLARNLNHIATDSTQFTYHVEQNAPPLSLKKGYIDPSQAFVGFDNTYTFTLPQWGYLAKNIIRLQYDIKPLQRTHVTPVLPMYHMIDKVELMSHNNVIETLYGDSIMIKHAYYSESDCATTKILGTLNVPPESSSYVDIAALFKSSTTGAPFNPFDSSQWNNTTNKRTVTLFLELPFSFTDNPAMYFDTRFVEYLTVQVKLSSTKHGLPLFQAACAVEVDMGLDNIQLDPTKHKNSSLSITVANNVSDFYEDKAGSGSINQTATDSNKGGAKNGELSGLTSFYYRPYYSRCIGAGGESNDKYRDGTTSTLVAATDDIHIRRFAVNNSGSSEGAVIADAGGCDPCELQLGARPQSRLPSIPPVWMKGFYPAADSTGLYACAHAGEPRFLRIGACNFNPTHYTVGYWGFLETGAKDGEAGADGTYKYGMNTKGLGKGGLITPEDSWKTNGGVSGDATGAAEDYTYSDKLVRENAALWAQQGGMFVYKNIDYLVSGAPADARSQGNVLFGTGTNSRYSLSKNVTSKVRVMIDTKVALIERFYAMYPYLNLSNQPSSTTDMWTGSSTRGNSSGSYGHGHMATDAIIVEGSQNNAASEGLPEKGSVSMKLLVTYLSLHDRVREQVSMDNFKDNMPATILMHDTFQEYNGLIYGSADSPWATSTDQTMVVPIRSKNLAYAISVIAYRNRTDAQLVGGDVYNRIYDGRYPVHSKMDVSMESLGTSTDAGTMSAHGDPQGPSGLLNGSLVGLGRENHMSGEIRLIDRETMTQTSGALAYNTLGGSRERLGGTIGTFVGLTDTKQRWNDRKARYNETTAKLWATGAAPQSAEIAVVERDDGKSIGTWQAKGPVVLSDPSFTWPNYKVVENFKTVKPTHVKLSIAGQSIYETASQTAIGSSYYSTSSDSYVPTKGGGQWFVEKDLDNLPYHYNQGNNTRGDMGSVMRLPNIVGTSQMGGSLQEHCDAHVITFGLNKTDQLSNNGALGLSSATNAQLELKFAEPCRVSVYVHYHATLQIDSNTGVMSRSLDV